MRKEDGYHVVWYGRNKKNEVLNECSTQEEVMSSPTISTKASDGKAHLAKVHKAILV